MTEPTYKALPQIMRIELRGYRKRRRLTIADVAAQLGLHEHTIRRWESGLYAPTTTELDRWARVLGLEFRMELVDTVPVPALVESKAPAEGGAGV